MTENVPLHEVASHVEELVDRAANGEEIVITRDGKPAARLVPVAGQPMLESDRVIAREPQREVRLGLAKGKIWMADDFDETPEWLIDAFYGIDADLPFPDHVLRDIERAEARKKARETK